MRKSTLFISAALTAFTLAVLAGVASAYQNIVSSTQPVANQAQPAEVAQVAALEPAQVPAQDPTQIPAQVPAPAQPANITPEQAASIASSTISRTDLYSVEVAQFNGADVYLVTFSSGDLVYVDFQGNVVSISKLAVTVISKPGGGGGRSKISKGGGESGEHESGEGGGDD